jgi:hypothetical protein
VPAGIGAQVLVLMVAIPLKKQDMGSWGVVQISKLMPPVMVVMIQV